MIAWRQFVEFCKQLGHSLTATLMINKDVDQDKSLPVHWSVHLVGTIWIIVNFSNVLTINYGTEQHIVAQYSQICDKLTTPQITRVTFQLSNTGPKQHLAGSQSAESPRPPLPPAALLWWASTSLLLRAFLTFTFNLFRSDTSQWLSGDPYDLGQSWRGIKQVFRIKHGGNVGLMGIIKRFDGNGLKQLCQSWSFPFCFYQLLRVLKCDAEMPHAKKRNTESVSHSGPHRC